MKKQRGSFPDFAGAGGNAGHIRGDHPLADGGMEVPPTCLDPSWSCRGAFRSVLFGDARSGFCGRFCLAPEDGSGLCAESQASPATGKPEADAHAEKKAKQCTHGRRFSICRHGGKPPHRAPGYS